MTAPLPEKTTGAAAGMPARARKKEAPPTAETIRIELRGLPYQEGAARLSPAAKRTQAAGEGGKVARPEAALKPQPEATPGTFGMVTRDVEMAGAGGPESTRWSLIIRNKFRQMDKDDDGFLSKAEINRAVSDDTFIGADAAAIATLHQFIADLEELSNDEWGDEDDGLTMADIEAYERGTFDRKSRLGGLERTHVLGVNRIRGTERRLLWKGVPDLDARRQGAIGDCYFLAALGAHVARNPGDLVRMIQENKDGDTVTSYTVTFPGRWGSLTVEPPTEAEIARYSSADLDGLWVVVMEKAYAFVRSGQRNPDIQEEIGEGGPLSEGLSAFTAAGTDRDILSLTRKETTRRKLDAAFGRGRGRDAGKRRLVTAAIHSENDYGLPRHHAYSIIGWDGQFLTIRNPWGQNPRPAGDRRKLPEDESGKDPYQTGVFRLPIEEFDRVFFRNRIRRVRRWKGKRFGGAAWQACGPSGWRHAGTMFARYLPRRMCPRTRRRRPSFGFSDRSAGRPWGRRGSAESGYGVSRSTRDQK